MSTCRRMRLNPYLTPYTKINQEWIEDLHVRPKTIKLLEENIGQKLRNIRLNNDVFDQDTKTTGDEREKNRQIGLHENLKMLCIKRH
mgnify:CR=1 FL=1